MTPEQHNAWPFYTVALMLASITLDMCRGFVGAAVRNYALYIQHIGKLQLSSPCHLRYQSAQLPASHLAKSAAECMRGGRHAHAEKTDTLLRQSLFSVPLGASFRLSLE